MKLELVIILACLIPVSAFAQQVEADRQMQQATVMKIGMSEELVIQILGKPSYKSVSEDGSIWWYPGKKFVHFEKGLLSDATFALEESQDKSKFYMLNKNPLP